jgi:hypothetical protein
VYLHAQYFLFFTYNLAITTAKKKSEKREREEKAKRSALFKKIFFTSSFFMRVNTTPQRLQFQNSCSLLLIVC